MSSISALGILCIVATMAQVAKGNEEGRRTSLGAEIDVHGPSEWFAGKNLWIAVAIKNTKSRDIRGPIQEEPMFNFKGYWYSLISHPGKVVAYRRETPMCPFQAVGDYSIDGRGQECGGLELVQHYTLKKNGCLRLLFSIPWPDGAAIEPGEYEVVLTILGVTSVMGPDVRMRITVRRPRKQDGLELQKSQEESSHLELPDTLTRGGLTFEKLLQSIIATEEPLGELEDDDLEEDLPELFQPEIAVMKYEILKAKGRHEDAAALRGRTLEAHPGLQFRFEDADNGTGIIARARAFNQTRQGPNPHSEGPEEDRERQE